jgi:Ca2+-binding RTX toxin-like protein
VPFNVSNGQTGNFVLGNNGSRIYVAGLDGNLRVYDTESGGLVATWDIGNKLGAIDISPDGTFLLITEQVPVAFHSSPNDWTTNSTTSAVYKVDTSTGQFQTLTYESTGSDYVLADVAITSNGTALLTENILPGWSGWTPMVRFDLAGSTFTKLPGNNYYQAGSLTSSPHDATILFGQLHLSSAEADIFSAQGAVLANNGIYKDGVYGYAQGVEAYSGAGPSGRVAISTGGLLHLWNGNFGYLANLTQAHSELSSIVGLRFSGDGETLYALSASSDQLFAISMADLTVKFSLAVGNYDTNPSAWGDELVLSPDENYYFMQTTAGIIRGDLWNVAAGTPHDDAFAGTERADHYSALDGNDIVSGGGGDDVLDGGGGSDNLSGDGGDDLLDGGTGADAMAGGLGNDVFYVDDAGDQVFEMVGQGNDTVYTSISYTLAAGQSIEALVLTDPSAALSLTGNALGQTIVGNAGANLLTGGGGSDYLVGLGGDDVLVGNADAASTLEGGIGNDTYYVNRTGDSVIEAVGQGNDRVYASVSFTLGAGQEVETLSAADPSATTPIGLTGNALAQVITGNAGADVLVGGGGNDYLVGLGGDDILVGNADAASTLQGGTGNDWYYLLRTGDSIVEFAGEGNDRILTSVSYTLSAGQEIETLSALDPAATTALGLTGNALGQVINGNAGANVLTGGGGNDYLVGLGGDDILIGNADASSTLQGGTGNDWYYVSRTGDSLVEFAGEGNDRILTSVSYTLSAGQEIETLSAVDQNGTAAIDLVGNDFAQVIFGTNGANGMSGNGGADQLAGFGGEDVILGGDGDDQLNGGLGHDVLNGGNGADLFVFADALGGGNVDTVSDFAPGADRIALDHNIFAGLATGLLSAGAFVVGNAAQDANDRIIYNQAAGQLWFDADGSGAGDPVLFATLANQPTITASDFVVI